jgi:hypothetical protein
MQASLAEAFMWAKFQVKIQKYSFPAKVGSYRKKNQWKLDILPEKSQKSEFFFTRDTAH